MPAGDYEYKAPLNNAWDENYGQNATANGANIPLNLAAAASVKFFYSHETHWITDNKRSVIATVPGDFQSELGCSGDWDPSCLRSWLQDPEATAPTASTQCSPPATTRRRSRSTRPGTRTTAPAARLAARTSSSTSPRATRSGSRTTRRRTSSRSGPLRRRAADSVTIAGSLQSELGCASDWDPACAATHLTYDANDTAWQGTFMPRPASYEYKAALDDSWDENYGLHATLNGLNIPLAASGGSVKFYYSHATHWVTDNVNSVIATAPGDYQSELGCSGDWDPSCLRSWLQDPGRRRHLRARGHAAGRELRGQGGDQRGWDENYGAGGVLNGPNIPFTVTDEPVKFSYNATTHVLTIQTRAGTPNDIEWDGVRHDSRDPLYRTPGGAVPAKGTAVALRLRTFHDDVTRVRARVYDLNTNALQLLEMERAASDVSCYQGGLGDRTCDFWQVTVNRADPDNLWYRFIVTDGTDTDYYDDDTAALDGGLGA